MSWAFFALLVPLFWSLGNVIDQYLAWEAFQRSALSFLIISGFVTLPIAAAFAIFSPQVFDIPPATMGILLIGGAIGFAGVWPYLAALKEDDASNAVPVLQAVPAFAYLLGYFLLGEELALVQTLGGVLVVAGAVAFVWNPQTRQIHFRTLLLMLSTAIIWAAYAIWVRYWSLELPWIVVVFWNYIAWLSIGAAGMAASRRIRGDFANLLKPGLRHVFIPLMFLQQAFACLAEMLMTKSFSVAPTAVQVVLFNGIQPVVITLLCGLLYFRRPDIFERVQWNRRLAVRFCCAAVTMGGLFLLAR